MATLRQNSGRNKSVSCQKVYCLSLIQVAYVYPEQKHMEWSYIAMIYTQNHFPVLSRKKMRSSVY